MRDMLGLAFDAAIVGAGLLSIGYTLWRASVSRRRPGPTSQRAARLWQWRIVLGLCGGGMGICFGGYLLLQDVGLGGFDWLVIAGFLATGGLLVAMLMLADLEGNGRSPQREPDNDIR